MCPPIIAAVAAAAPATQAALALGAVSTGLQIRGQQIQAKTQRRVQANASKVERQRYLNEVSSLRTQQSQEQVALAQKLQANKRKAMEAQSTAAVFRR
jgi:tRNA U54 and U55 pseudouridine synthase Pus10